MHLRPLRILLLGAAFLLASAAIVAFGVIPPVRSDTFPLATPDRAVPAFWGNVLLSVLAAATALASSRAGSTRATLRRVLPGVAGLVALLLGLLLIDAATAFSGHGPEMHGAVVALWVCVCLDLAGGASMVVSALVRRG
jgi:hypothetical protein